MARFDAYRAEQLDFLDKIITNADTEYNAKGVDYRIGLSHIPLTFVKKGDPLQDQKFAWVKRLNQMNLDILFSGHRHELMFADANQDAGTNLTVTPDFDGNETILRFTNESGEIVETISPWLEGVDYGKKIRVKNK